MCDMCVYIYDVYIPACICCVDVSDLQIYIYVYHVSCIIYYMYVQAWTATAPSPVSSAPHALLPLSGILPRRKKRKNWC